VSKHLVNIALDILSKPEASDESIRAEVRQYLSGLSVREYVELADEALADKSETRAVRMELLTSLGMSSREVYEYSKYRLSSHDVRKAIAWRAVLAKRLGWSADQLRQEHFFGLEERELLMNIRELSIEDAIKELQDGR